jgi:hypothetical protein
LSNRSATSTARVAHVAGANGGDEGIRVSFEVGVALSSLVRAI